MSAVMRRRFLVAAGLVIIAALTSKEAAGQTVYRACFIPGTGTLYLVGQEAVPPSCVSSDHVEIQWNEQGPIGDPGPAGQTGPQGAPGIANYGIQNANAGWTPVTGQRNVYEMTLSCDRGQKALSVGISSTSARHGIIAAVISGPENSDGYYRVSIQGGQPEDVTAQLVCADVT